MAIRIPTQGILDVSAAASEVGAGSVAGGIAYPFQIPQDTDNVVVKFTASVVVGYSATFQTSDDGGTTYYDVARTSIVSNANNTTAQWLSIPAVNAGVATGQTFATGSIVSMGIGNTAASTLGSRQISGLPILGIQNRVFVRITGDITNAAANTYNVKVLVNEQSASAN